MRDNPSCWTVVIAGLCIVALLAIPGRVQGDEERISPIARKLGELVSPGPLTSLHRPYEGLRNCVRCHRLDKAITDNKCLECHKKIDERNRQRKGYHPTLSGRCVTCHTDHKGLDFRIIKFDRDAFDHDKTIYALHGKHREVKCDACHERMDPKHDIKREIFIGLPTTCLGCHKDPHRGHLRQTCETCHTDRGWKRPNLAFNHDNAKYPLRGAHAKVECSLCHKNSQWVGIPYQKCLDCHADPHKRQFAAPRPPLPGAAPVAFRPRTKLSCEGCHQVKGWKGKDLLFAHNTDARYRLEGKHGQVACTKCHTDKRWVGLTFQRCNDCHKDVHRGGLSAQTCRSCHNTGGWKRLATFWKRASFDHAKLRYPLEGKHREVQCLKCHRDNKWRSMAFGKCDDCHRDVHRGQFAQTQCETCHKVHGWKGEHLLFVHNRDSSYKLTGPHEPVGCEACHANGQFIPTQKECAGCHRIAKAFMAGKIDGPQASPDPHFRIVMCEQCHRMEQRVERSEVIQKTCVGCHNKFYGDLLLAWRDIIDRDTATILAALPEEVQAPGGGPGPDPLAVLTKLPGLAQLFAIAETMVKAVLSPLSSPEQQQAPLSPRRAVLQIKRTGLHNPQLALTLLNSVQAPSTEEASQQPLAPPPFPTEQPEEKKP